MIAYKGFHKDLTCKGYQFYTDRVNVTESANCAENGFHCAENPLDCLSYYSNWRDSVYYIVKAEGDIDEDGRDSKISCTHLSLLKELSLEELLLHALAYMVRYPMRRCCSRVVHEQGIGYDGFVLVRGKHPYAKGQIGDLLAFAREAPDSDEIMEVALFVIDGTQYVPDVWYDIQGASRDEGDGEILQQNT